MKNTMNLMDARCEKTRAAVEKSFCYFYTKHSFFEQLPIVHLCKMANISTPTFYRHFTSLFDVAKAEHEKIHLKLTEIITPEISFPTSLLKIFHFMKVHEVYYRMCVFQMNCLPFSDIAKLIRPKITTYLNLVDNRKAQMICREAESYAILELWWWVSDGSLDMHKAANEVIRKILIYANQCLVRKR